MEPLQITQYNLIDTLFVDIDGVMCRSKSFDSNGNCLSKEFCDKDWTAIKRFKAIGVKVVFLTGDGWNKWIQYKRNTPVIITRGQCKSDFIKSFCEDHGISIQKCAFIGDDLFDIGAMKLCGYTFCPLDSPRIVKSHSDHVLKKNGGEGVISALFDLCEDLFLIKEVSFEDVMLKIEELDKKEQF